MEGLLRRGIHGGQDGDALRRSYPRQEPTMAKGQKKSNKETRKPKQEKAKPSATPGSFLGQPDRSGGKK
jgi:hypothetical protein